jgi:hypothetical protein
LCQDKSEFLPLIKIGTEDKLGTIYRFIDENNIIFYIGRTTQHIVQRLAGHAQDKQWFNSIAKLEIKYVPLDELYNTEAAEIHAYHPSGNRTCPFYVNKKQCGWYRKKPDVVYDPAQAILLEVALKEKQEFYQPK